MNDVPPSTFTGAAAVCVIVPLFVRDHPPCIVRGLASRSNDAFGATTTAPVPFHVPPDHLLLVPVRVSIPAPETVEPDWRKLGKVELPATVSPWLVEKRYTVPLPTRLAPLTVNAPLQITTSAPAGTLTIPVMVPPLYVLRWTSC